MLRSLIIVCLSLPLSAGAADVTIGIANQHKSALDIAGGRFTGLLAKTFQCPLDRTGLKAGLLQDLGKSQVLVAEPEDAVVADAVGRRSQPGEK